MNGKFHRRRSVGRPRLRWEDNIRLYSSLLLNIRGWRGVVGDRDVWRQLLERPGLDVGCRAVEEEEIKRRRRERRRIRRRRRRRRLQ